MQSTTLGKGGVEGEVGYFRRNYLTPVPVAASLEELNARIVRWEEREDARRIGTRMRTIGQDFQVEAPGLRPLPGDGYDTRVLLTPAVDRYAMITVRTCRYSVPARLIGRRVRVMLGASELVVYDRHTEVARHARLTGRGQEHPVLDHYLEILLRKPGALSGSRALEQARKEGAFTTAHEALWSAARARLGETAGTRALIEVLLLHRRMHPEDIADGIRAALAVGSHNVDLIALEARKAAERHGRAPTVTAHTAPLADRLPEIAHQAASLTARRLSRLAEDTRPLPALDAYDQLLHRDPRTDVS